MVLFGRANAARDQKRTFDFTLQLSPHARAGDQKIAVYFAESLGARQRAVSSGTKMCVIEARGWNSSVSRRVLICPSGSSM